MELAVELGSGICPGCDQQYMSASGRTNNNEVEELVMRLVASIE
jgi:hypothetical protein